MKIQIELAAHLSQTLKDELKSRVDREFGHVEIVRTHVWAQPTWALLGYVESELVSFLNIVDRMGSADGKPIRLFGLNNVITEPGARKLGYSRLLNEAAIEFMKREDSLALGLLFCADELIPFYSRLGWEMFKGRVIIAQPAGEKIWPSNCMTHRLGRGEQVVFEEIHLKGLPW